MAIIKNERICYFGNNQKKAIEKSFETDKELFNEIKTHFKIECDSKLNIMDMKLGVFYKVQHSNIPPDVGCYIASLNKYVLVII